MTLARSIAVILYSKWHEISKLTLIVADRADLMRDGSIEAQIHCQQHKLDQFKFHHEAGLPAVPRDQQHDGFSTDHFASLKVDLSLESTIWHRNCTIQHNQREPRHFMLL